MKKLQFFLLLFHINILFGQQLNSENFIKIKNKYFKNAVYAETYLPKNVDKSGNTDYTDLLQKAATENTRLIFPNYPVLISDKGISFISNQYILFQPDSRLILKGTKRGGYEMIKIKNVANVKVYFLNIEGDKYRHLSDKGEWGHGVSIKSSNNIILYKPVISKCWGDGIYIGQETAVPQNITVNGGFINDNRRNGISVISGINITLENITISNTKGHNPQSGIDIEPNNGKNRLTNIVLNNITTKNNAVHGIIISTGNLNGSTQPISIAVNNHKDYNSAIALGLSVTRNNLNYIQPLNGKITISNSNYTLPGTAFIRNYKGKKSNINLSLQNMKFKRSEGAGASARSSSAPALLDRFLSDFKQSLNSDVK
ncbi:right-handed parallel beta-helix repeat-containing protein [Chryseobacterium salviniae]|uniref:Right-handed parallel beta-helix repeat-containing protein n=1 Tax=Chryseobacterium salviniae TaxID=3101750 RepID=A0ABU6HR04_9FLAO|nr:right-handed parallel beta-helix repeat-containing protein [Chryseobacterium sp. T9W2-O]MEC3875081.1 right-handed parallel beta-helix repeat-containing protein [Chryseobacterium sp. T9W2-O]